jgi:uncharacterized protein (DUF924 family)
MRVMIDASSPTEAATIGNDTGEGKSFASGAAFGARIRGGAWQYRTMPDPSPAEVVAFWKAAGPKKWFAKDAAFDAEIRDRFLETHFAAARRELDGWAVTAEGALALLILLDQFPRNLFRGSGHAFATDPLARGYATSALEAGFDRDYPQELRCFFYLPLEHSERLEDQERSVLLTADLSDNDRRYAIIHRDIIARFGRFPHRNACLGRATTEEEQAFLDAGGFAG